MGILIGSTLLALTPLLPAQAKEYSSKLDTYVYVNNHFPFTGITPKKSLISIRDHIHIFDSFGNWNKNKSRVSDEMFISHSLEKNRPNETVKFNSKLHDKIQNLVSAETEKSIVIIPVLTSSAYSDHGFYSYYRGECDKTCLTVKIRDDLPASLIDSESAVMVLKSLGYHTITDIDVDKNPALLSQFDEVIVLHNEYVTQREFDAITHHPNVLHLYPNSLYAKVSIDYLNNMATLIRGHGYPVAAIRNGFDWKFDNSKFEYDRECANWNFTKIGNGIMLNCYPEGPLGYDSFLLKAIQDF